MAGQEEGIGSGHTNLAEAYNCDFKGFTFEHITISLSDCRSVGKPVDRRAEFWIVRLSERQVTSLSVCRYAFSDALTTWHTDPWL